MYTYNGRPIFFSTDGDAICATLDAPEFVCPPEDPIGYGYSEAEAVNELCKELALDEIKDRM